MQNSVVRFPASTDAPRTIIDPRKLAIASASKVARVGVSSSVESFIQYPSFVAAVGSVDYAASSMQRMEAVYERVTAFLQKMQDDDFGRK